VEKSIFATEKCKKKREFNYVSLGFLLFNIL